MVRSTRWTSLIFAILTLSPLVAGADSSGMYAPERVGRGYLGGGVGGFWEESNTQLKNAKAQSGGFFGGGYRASPYIGLELDGLSYQQRVNTPPTVSSSIGRSRLTTSGVGGVVKFILPLDRIELFAGGGVGAYNTSLRTSRNPFRDDEENDTNIGYQGLIGADYFITPHFSVGLEYRKLKIDADLGPTIPGGKFDAGGDFLFATFRGHF